MSIFKSVEFVDVIVSGTSQTVALTKGQDHTQCTPFFSTMQTNAEFFWRNHTSQLDFIDDAGTPTIRFENQSRLNGEPRHKVFVVEWDPSITVQQIDVVNVSAGTRNVTIDAVSHQSASFIMLSLQKNEPGGTNDYDGVAVRARFTSDTNVLLSRLDSLAAFHATLYIVTAENGEFTVDHQSIEVVSSANSFTKSIPATEPSASFLLHSYDTNAGLSRIKEGQWYVELENSESLRIFRNKDAITDWGGDHAIQIIEAQNGEWTVQRSGSWDMDAAETAAQLWMTGSIEPIDQTRAFINLLDNMAHFAPTPTNDSTNILHIDDTMMAFSFEDDSTIRSDQKGGLTGGGTASVEIIQFSSPPVPEPTSSAPSDDSMIQLTWPASGSFTGSIEGDRSASVSFFGTASFAPDVDDALTAVSASHAAQADSVPTADSAETALSASHALQADSALTADSATTATSASHALQADAAATADLAATATSASHALQADSALTADTAVTASHAVDFDGTVEASQVQPGSFATGSFVFSGDVTITGTASINHLDIGSTSQILESGSSIFGDSLDDIHQFTGSILVSGSVVADLFVGDGAGIVGIISASHALRADTASFADTAATASFVSASAIQGTVESASFAETASFAENALGSDSTSFADKAAVAPLNIALNTFLGTEAKLDVPVVVTEPDIGERAFASLAGYTQARVIIRVTKAPNVAPAGVIAIEGSLDDTTYVFLAGGTAGAGDGGPSGSISGTIGSAFTVTSPWADITGTLAVDDIFLRWVTYSGSDAGGNARPQIGSINLQVR